jgi:hypothetical protein
MILTLFAYHADGIKKPTRGQTALRFAGGMLLLSIIVLVVSFGATVAYIRDAAWISPAASNFRVGSLGFSATCDYPGTFWIIVRLVFGLFGVVQLGIIGATRPLKETLTASLCRYHFTTVLVIRTRSPKSSAGSQEEPPSLCLESRRLPSWGAVGIARGALGSE